MLRKNVAGQFLHIAGVNVSTGAIVTGATWTMRRCLDGTFAAGGATITEDTGTGFYKVALTQADTNGNDCGYFFTATNCVPVTLNAIMTACDPTTATNFGITALPAVASGSAGAVIVSGTGTAALSVSSGLVTLAGVTHTGAVIPTVTTTTTATNLTNAPTSGDFTAVMKTSIGTAVAASAVASVTGNVGGNVTGSVGSVTGLTASNLDVAVSTRLATAGYTTPPTAAQNATAVLTTQMTESYRANGAAPTVAEALFETIGHLGESSIAATTKTVKKVDHTTTAATFTLNDATTPTSISRAT